MKRIGVILVCFHTSKVTLTCAEMYAKMKCVDWVVIVDNETDAISKEVFDKIDNEKMSVLYQMKNLGYSKGNNVGIKYLMKNYDVNYIIVSNSDVIVNEKSITHCINILEKNKSIGAVAPIMKDPYNCDYALRFIKLGYLRILLRVIVPEKTIDRMTQQFCKKTENIIQQSFLPGSFFISKTNALQDCGGFDERIFLYREEEILGKRLEKVNYIEAVVSDCYFIHKHDYKAENAEIIYKRNIIAMKSEQLYFREYLNSNRLQMMYVILIEKIYIFTRYIAQIVKDILKQI